MKPNRLRRTAVVVLVAVSWSGVVFAEDAPPAKTLDVVLQEQLQPNVREWVAAEAQNLARTPNPQEAAVRADIRKRFQGQALAAADEDRLAYLIVFEAVQAADRDLKHFVEQIKAGGATARPAAAQNPSAGAGIQATQTGLPPRGSTPNGNVVFQPGPAPNGASSVGIGGVTVGGGSVGGVSSTPGGMTLTPVQATQLQILSNSRNQVARLANILGRAVPPTLDTQIQNLK